MFCEIQCADKRSTVTMTNSQYRLILSAAVAFMFYFAWTYWANAMVSSDQHLVLRAAIVQGSLSASITFLFTFALEFALKRFGESQFSLMFIVPILCGVHAKTSQNIAIFRTFKSSLERSARFAEGAFLPGVVLSPLIPLVFQASITISVNVINQTPNLWLTVAPSIIFSAIYGYTYTITLYKSYQKGQAPTPPDEDY